MTEQLVIEEVNRLELRKDEILVLKVGSDATQEGLKNFRKSIDKALPKLSHKILILAGDVELTKVRGI
jgi:hypothetical protein